MNAMMTSVDPGTASWILFGVFFTLMVLRVPVAIALGLACLPADADPRAESLADDAGAGDLQRIQLVHPAGGAVLPADRQPDEHRRHHRPASQSKIFIDAQRKEGYDDSLSVAITAVSAVLAVIIPPSILMIVWGGVLSVSIGALFLAGVIPGLLLGLVQMATVHAYAKRRGYPTYGRSTFKVFLAALPVALPALMTPAIIIVGTILQPLAQAVAMDPVQFAMIGIVSLAFGLVTPPYGLCLMIACSITKVTMASVLKDTMIMLIPMLGVLVLVIVWPDVALILPKLISPEYLK
ncbi:MAG: TRAP transporter large permease subunit [Burkholderiales bacterium]|jgi:TRAP-type C4-dicarboxylate transport system permease large subunit